MLRNVAIYAFSSGKFPGVRKYACAKDLTNIMPVKKSSHCFPDLWWNPFLVARNCAAIKGALPPKYLISMTINGSFPITLFIKFSKNTGEKQLCLFFNCF